MRGLAAPDAGAAVVETAHDCGTVRLPVAAAAATRLLRRTAVPIAARLDRRRWWGRAPAVGSATTAGHVGTGWAAAAAAPVMVAGTASASGVPAVVFAF